MLVNTYSKQIPNRNQTFIELIWHIQFKLSSNSEQFSKIKLVQKYCIRLHLLLLYIILLSPQCCLSNTNRVEILRNLNVSLHRNFSSFWLAKHGFET